MTMDLTLLYDFLNVILINLVLSGDNAVVLAMAVMSLPQRNRKKGMIIGAACSVAINVVLIFYVAELLQINYIRFIGGAVITVIAIKICLEAGAYGEEDQGQHSTSIFHAIKIIAIANITMSFDNIMGVAAVSKGNIYLLISGLAVSIPIVFYASNLLVKLLDKYPVVVFVAAAILGKLGAELVMTDPFMKKLIQPEEYMIHLVELIFAAAIVTTGFFIRKKRLLDLSNQEATRDAS